MTELLLAQLADPFRIGLLIALFATMLRTENATGRYVPLAVGALFVAILIPVATQGGFDATRVGVGILANAIILAVVSALWTVFQRLKG